jgi:hypothetical protein
MKIRDIVNEAYHGFVGHKTKEYGKVKRGTTDMAIPNARIEPQLRNTDTYMQMRYGMALAAAAAGGDDFEQESVWSENIGLVGYTDADVERIKAADKIMGVKSIEISGRKSQERGDVGKASPVANTSWRKAKK